MADEGTEAYGSGNKKFKNLLEFKEMVSSVDNHIVYVTGLL